MLSMQPFWMQPFCTNKIKICKDDQTVLPKSDNMQKPKRLQMWPIFSLHVVFLMAVIIVIGK